MWISIALAWLSFAVITVVLWSARRSSKPGPVDEALGEFAQRLRQELRERHPDVAWCGLSAERRSVILVVSGQETPIPLNPIFRHFQAFPSAFDQVVDRMIAEVREEGLHEPSDHEFAEVVLDIMPQIKSSSWLHERSGVFGQSALLARELGEDLGLCYVIDESWSMIFICREHLRRWHKSDEDIHQLAIANLRRRSGNQMCQPDDLAEPLLLQTGDGYDAARLLLLDRAADGEFILAVPDRDMLWVGSEAHGDLDAIGELARRRHARAVHPVSPDLFRLGDGRLAKLTPITADL